jgi:hypothetical protein
MPRRRFTKSRTRTKHPAQKHRDRRGYLPPATHIFMLGVDSLGDPAALLSVTN